MNGNWTDYRVNQLYRQGKMREAEQHRLSQAADGRNQPHANRVASILANLLALVG